MGNVFMIAYSLGMYTRLTLIVLDKDPGGVLPYITYTGMCRPTGS